MSAELFEATLQELVAALPVDRAVVLYGSLPHPCVRATHRLPRDHFWKTAEMSLSLLEEVLGSGRPLLITDVRDQDQGRDHLSLMLTDVRSLVCVPLWGPQGGIAGAIYADSRGRFGALTRAHLDLALKQARELERRLHPRATPAQSLRQPAKIVERANPGYTSRNSQTLKSPPQRSRAIFFRSLATLFGAAIPLHQSLALLGERGEEPRMREIAMELARRVHRGQNLTEAMRALGTFSSFEVHLVEAGLRSGALHRTLGALADYQEERHRQRHALVSALVYPSLAALVCLALLVITPATLLKGQFQLLGSLGVSLPWLTRVLMAASAALASPWVWLGLGLVGAVLTRMVRREWLARLLLRMPILGSALLAHARSRFSRALSLQLESGLQVAGSLRTAGSVSGWTRFASGMGAAVSTLEGGARLREALAATELFPRTYLEMVSVGEESGRLPEILAWLAEFEEQAAQVSLQSLTASLEPLVMLGMGLLTCVLCLGTMLPMVRALQSL